MSIWTNETGRVKTDFGYRFRALRDSVLGEFTRKNEANRCLNFTRWDSRFLGIRGELCNQHLSALIQRVDKGKHILEASVAILSKISFTNELRIAIALLEIPVSGCTCFNTKQIKKSYIHQLLSSYHPREWDKRTLVDVGRVSLLSALSPLLLSLAITWRGLRSLLRSLWSTFGCLCGSLGGSRGRCFTSSRSRLGSHIDSSSSDKSSKDSSLRNLSV